MKPIRVLQVVSFMGQGGIENLLMNIYRNIDRSKVQFDFLVHTDQKQYFDDEIESLGGIIYRLPRTKHYQLFKTCRNYDRFFHDHPEYKIVHSHINTWSTLVLRSAKKANVPIRIAHAHTTQQRLSLEIFLKMLSGSQLNKYVTDRFTCSTEAAQWVYGRKNKNNAKIVKNGVDMSLFHFDSNKRTEYRAQLNLSDQFTLIHVGSFNSGKNQPFLIDVFAELYRKNKNVTLILIGNGNTFEAIQQKVQALGLENQVHFLGIKGDVNNWLNAADCFVFPSVSEGLPVSLIEAQACGLPVIASDSISREVVVSDLIRFESIQQSPEYWAEVILKETQKQHDSRDSYIRAIKNGGYDINDTVEWLTNFYLQKHDESIQG